MNFCLAGNFTQDMLVLYVYAVDYSCISSGMVKIYKKYAQQLFGSLLAVPLFLKTVYMRRLCVWKVQFEKQQYC
jgi:hypothetical protein